MDFHDIYVAASATVSTVNPLPIFAFRTQQNLNTIAVDIFNQFHWNHTHICDHRMLLHIFQNYNTNEDGAVAPIQFGMDCKWEQSIILH